MSNNELAPIIERPINDIFADSYAVFGAATVKDRALPSVEDGFNPVTRRIMYAIHSEGYSLRYRKTAFYVGLVLGRFHPHGDNAVYQTMVGLSQPFNKLNPLLEAQGNNGSISDPKSFAAARYLEMRESLFAKNILMTDMNDAYIPMKDNYDNTLKEPVVLPSMFPMILHIGNQGIASGFASEMPPHKVDDVCDITLKYIDNPDVKTKDLVKNFRPEFPNGAVITNEAAIPAMYENGGGVIKVQATIETITHRKKEALAVTSLPYKVSTNRVMLQLAELASPGDRKKEPGILHGKLHDILDASDMDTPVNLILVPTNGTSVDVLRNLVLNHTALTSSVKYIPNVILGKDLLENASIKDILKGWLDFRVKTLSAKYNHAIYTKANSLTLKKALLKAHGKIDHVIKLIKGCSSEDNAVEGLMKLLSITETEARYIANIKLYQIAKLEVDKLEKEIKALEDELKGLMKLVSSRDEILKVIKEQLTKIKNDYKAPRKTQLQNSGKIEDQRSVIESEDLVIAVTMDNYIYAKPSSELRTHSSRGAKGYNFIDKKYKRVARDLLVVNSHDDLLVFTNTGRMFELKGYELNLWNKPISSVLDDLGTQRVVCVLKVDFEACDKHSILMVTKNSLMKRLTLEEAKPKRKMSGGMIAIPIGEGDALLTAIVVNEDERILIATNHGRGQNLATQDVAITKRPALGFAKALLADNEYLVRAEAVKDSDEEFILIATADGSGKRILLGDIPKRRGESGRRSLMKLISLRKGDELIDARAVEETDSLVAITSDNLTTKLAANTFPITGRNAFGVKIMTLEDNKLLNVVVTDE